MWWRTGRSTFAVPILRRCSSPQPPVVVASSIRELNILSRQMINISHNIFVVSLVAEWLPATHSKRVDAWAKYRTVPAAQLLNFFPPSAFNSCSPQMPQDVGRSGGSISALKLNLFDETFSYFIIIHLHFRILCKLRERKMYWVGRFERRKKKIIEKRQQQRKTGFFHSPQKFSSFIRWLDFVFNFFFFTSLGRGLLVVCVNRLT